MSRPLEQTTRLAILRSDRGFTRENLCSMAQDAGFPLSHSTLVQYERGERKPRVDLALWLSKIFGEEVEVLFG